ncbi:MAG TPA: carboxypeptidase-like regulatory domain-containing protein [Gemmatimonadaceae bacterium]|nr:carboxypeptidase-like regulatory domain-containing protein [Gemmatimonadaceae bacterium]
MKSNLRTLVHWAIAAMAGAAPLGAQTIRGIVTLPDSSRAAGVIVMATDAKGQTAARALTGEAGTYELRLSGAGHYDVKVLRIGFHPTLVPGFDVTASESKYLPIVLRGEAIVLTAVKVQGKSTCRMQRDSGQAVAHMWAEASKAIEATQLTQGGAKQTVKWRIYERNMDATGQLMLTQSSSTASATAMKAFVSLPPDSLAKVGYMSDDDPTGTIYRAPDAEALLSNAFASLHCFREVPPPHDNPDWVGIGFKPAKERDGIVEIEGTLWLDRTSSELRQLVFRYTNLPLDLARIDAGGTEEFLRLSTGRWLISSWELKMPRVARQLVPHYNGTGGARETYQTVITGIQFTGGNVTGVTRGQEVLFSTGESTHDFMPALLADDEKLAASCGEKGDSTKGDLVAMLRGTVFEGTHVGIPNASIKLTWRGQFKVNGKYGATFTAQERDITSDAAGNWYLCGVPRERLITVRAKVGDRFSASVTVRIPKERPSAGVDVEVPPP